MHTKLSIHIRRIFLRFIMKLLPPLDGRQLPTSGATGASIDAQSAYPNLYAAPTNGGIMPLDNGSWGGWSDHDDSTYSNNPLLPSNEELDSRIKSGHLDDYWYQAGSQLPEPYRSAGWPDDPWDSLGDYMRTSQYSSDKANGDTKFYTHDVSRSKNPKSSKSKK